MADLDVTVSIIDGADGLSDLELSETNGYFVRGGGLGVGPRSFRREIAEPSPFVAGRQLVSAVADVMIGNLSVRVEAADHDELRTRIAALRDRMEQLYYTLEITLEGNTDAWRCEAADSAEGDGGTLDEVLAMSVMQPITFTVPHDPTPL